MQLLDGKRLALKLKEDIKQKCSLITAIKQRQPGLAVVLVGQDPASEIYVRNKKNACQEVGILSFGYELPSTCSTQKLDQLIRELNLHPKIDGILVQLPLPSSIDSPKIIESIAPFKDVDGFHPYNLGCLAQRHPKLRPCTPYGIIQLLNHYGISLSGQHAVIVGASNIVGRPMALEFLLAGTTVTICHRFTQNLETHIRMANIVVAAAGICDLIHSEWLNSEQIIVDVGIHRLEGGILRGDIDFDKAKERVAWITPVPGGVGPMTISTLLQNTLQAAEAPS